MTPHAPQCAQVSSSLSRTGVSLPTSNATSRYTRSDTSRTTISAVQFEFIENRREPFHQPPLLLDILEVTPTAPQCVKVSSSLSRTGVSIPATSATSRFTRSDASRTTISAGQFEFVENRREHSNNLRYILLHSKFPMLIFEVIIFARNCFRSFLRQLW